MVDLTSFLSGSASEHGAKRRDGHSCPGGAPKLLHDAAAAIDSANGNGDEQGDDEAVEEVPEREDVGQEGFNALGHRAAP